MQNDSPATNDINFYEPRFCKLSAVYKSWVPLYVADLYKLVRIPGFEHTDVRFWKNHPIRWIQLVGVITGVTIKSSFIEANFDDGSGNAISLYIKGDAAELLNTNFEQNRCDLDVCDLVKVKGSISVDHRGDLQFVVKGILRLLDTETEISAWQERNLYKAEVLERPWRLDSHQDKELEVDESLADSKLGLKKRHKQSSDVANIQAKLKEEERAKSVFDLTTMSDDQHTQRNLKIMLLQYFELHSIHEFSVAKLRGDKIIEEAAECVARQTIRKQQSVLGMSVVDRGEVPVSTTQKFRTLTFCLHGLVRDGSILSIDTKQGTFAVIGTWNLGNLIKNVMREYGDSIRDEAGDLNIRALWMQIRQAGHGYESISKQMVRKVLDDLL